MSKISVIVPVYNVEKYLKKCVDSIINQTLEDIEIILVDDGSKDASGKICDEYAEKDERIIVIHKENGGLSSARNTGIEKASSSYLGFVDSDDYIEKNMYERLYDEAVSNKADLVMCDLYHCYEGKEPVKNPHVEKCIWNSEEAIKTVMEAKKTSVTAVNKLYKKELFADIRYPEGKLSEDAFVIVEILMQAKKIVFISEQFYYYVHRKNSITSSAYKPKDLNVLEAYAKNKKIIQKNYPNLIDTAEMRYMWAHFYVLDKMCLSKNMTDKDTEKKIINNLRRHYQFIMRDTRFNTSRKVAMTLLMINKYLYKLCVLLNRKNYIE